MQHVSAYVGYRIVLDKALFLTKTFSSIFFFFFFYIFPQKHVVGTQQKHLSEALLISTHNTYFHGEIRKKYLDPLHLELPY